MGVMDACGRCGPILIPLGKAVIPKNAEHRTNEIINPFHHIWYLSECKGTENEPIVWAIGYWLQIGACRYAGEL
jgi:hypothetical protein